MADYTDIDKLRELEVAATPAPWHAAVSVAGDPLSQYNVVHEDEDGNIAANVAYDYDRNDGYGACDEDDAKLIAAARNSLPSLLAELVGLRTEVDQLRGENAELRENVVHMESERTGKCLACGEDWTCSGYYADIAHEARVENLITAERDALQAEVERLHADVERQTNRADAVELIEGRARGLAQERVAALQAQLSEMTTYRNDWQRRAQQAEQDRNDEHDRVAALQARIDAARHTCENAPDPDHYGKEWRSGYARATAAIDGILSGAVMTSDFSAAGVDPQKAVRDA